MNEQRSCDTSVIVVTFNSAQTIEACVRSVPDTADLVVVDQRSTDDTVARVRAARRDATVVVAEVNRGFGAGCNLGVSRASGGLLVFLNPDAQFVGDACRRLAGSLGADAVSLVGPAIVDQAGNDHTECRTRGGPVRDALNLIVPQAWLPRNLRQDVPPDDPIYDVGGAVGYIQGSCIAIDRGDFALVGGFDEDFFLYSEEEWLADRLAVHGGVAALVPEARIVHIGKVSTKQTGWFSTEQHFRSRCLLYRKRGGLCSGLYGSAVLGGAVLILLLSWPIRYVMRKRHGQSPLWCLAALRGIWAAQGGRPVVPPDG
jgi:N-acetylglucosaminyl-diphospho-decaprenol L-rhamnosyltransferase